MHILRKQAIGNGTLSWKLSISPRVYFSTVRDGEPKNGHIKLSLWWAIYTLCICRCENTRSKPADTYKETITMEKSIANQVCDQRIDKRWDYLSRDRWRRTHFRVALLRAVSKGKRFWLQKLPLKSSRSIDQAIQPPNRPRFIHCTCTGHNALPEIV